MLAPKYPTNTNEKALRHFACGIIPKCSLIEYNCYNIFLNYYSKWKCYLNLSFIFFITQEYTRKFYF